MVGTIGFGAPSAWGDLAQSGVELIILIIARGIQGAFADTRAAYAPESGPTMR